MHPVFQAFLAQTAEGQAQAPSLLNGPLPMMIAVVAIFYFILIRPQQKQAKELRNFVASLKKGDEVFTQGGVVGTVALVEETTVTLDVGGGTKLRVLKSSVAGAFKPAAPKQETK